MPNQKYILIFILIFYAASFGQTQRYPFLLEEQNPIGAQKYSLFYDLDGDSVDERIDVHIDRQGIYSIRFYKMETETGALCQLNFPGQIISGKPLIFTQISKKIILVVPTIKNNSTSLHYFDITNINPIKINSIPIAEGADLNNDGFWDGYMTPRCAVDLNDDNYLDIILIISTAYDRYPRGVYAVDIHNNKLLWNYPSGAYYDNVVIGHLTNDHDLEIALCSAAMSNGASANGTSDSLSYVTVLDENGNCLFNQTFGIHPSQTFVHLADLNGDGQKKLITILSCKNYLTSKMGEIIIWDDISGMEKTTIPIETVHYSCVSDIDNDGKDELIVIVGSPKQKIKIFKNETLPSLIREIDILTSDLKVVDLTGNDKKEIIVSGSQQTIVFNHKLQKIAHTNTAGEIFIKHQGLNQIPQLVVKNDYLNFFTLKKDASYNRFVNSLFSKIIITSVPVIFIFLLILFNISKRLSTATLLSMLVTIPWPVFVFDRKKRLVGYNQSTLKITSKKHWEKPSNNGNEIETIINEKLDEIKKQYFRAVQTSKTFTLAHGKKLQLDTHVLRNKILRLNYIMLFLKDITNEKDTENVIQWSSVAQRLAHDIKNPLSIIKLTLQRLSMAIGDHKPAHRDEYDDRIGSALEEVERLRKATDGFMKLAKVESPNFKLYSLDSILSVVEDQLRKRIPETVELVLEREKNLPDLLVDLEQIVILFSNLVENSIRAMKARGIITLSCYLFQKIEPEKDSHIEDKIIFELTDTGEGIAEDKLSRVFEPFFSEEKHGTGLGLVICKRIVEDHKGDISISSKVGVGTTIRIELPVKNEVREE